MKGMETAFEYVFEQSALVQLAVFAAYGLLVFALSMAFVLYFNRRPDVMDDDLMSPAQINLPGPRSALAHYVRHVFRDEWRKTRNSHRSAEVDQAFRDVQQQIVAAEARLPSASAGQLHALLNEVARTRSDRLWVGGNHTEATSWLAVFVLGLLTHLAIASIHFDRPRAGAIALGLLSCTTTVAYWSLGIVDNPYRLMDNLDPSRWLPMAT